MYFNFLLFWYQKKKIRPMFLVRSFSFIKKIIMSIFLRVKSKAIPINLIIRYLTNLFCLIFSHKFFVDDNVYSSIFKIIPHQLQRPGTKWSFAFLIAITKLTNQFCANFAYNFLFSVFVWNYIKCLIKKCATSFFL